MSKPTMSEAECQAAAKLEGYRHMRAAGRTALAKADFDAARAMYEWLMDAATATTPAQNVTRTNP